jgi:hypothetical protein
LSVEMEIGRPGSRQRAAALKTDSEWQESMRARVRWYRWSATELPHRKEGVLTVGPLPKNSPAAFLRARFVALEGPHLRECRIYPVLRHPDRRTPMLYTEQKAGEYHPPAPHVLVIVLESLFLGSPRSALLNFNVRLQHLSYEALAHGARCVVPVGLQGSEQPLVFISPVEAVGKLGEILLWHH